MFAKDIFSISWSAYVYPLSNKHKANKSGAVLSTWGYPVQVEQEACHWCPRCSKSGPGDRRVPWTTQRNMLCISTKYHDEKLHKLKSMFMVFLFLQIWKMPSTIYFDQAVKNLCHGIWPWELYAEILRRCISS